MCIIIYTREQLDNYLKKFNCKDTKELEDILWFNYGTTLKLNIKKYRL